MCKHPLPSVFTSRKLKQPVDLLCYELPLVNETLVLESVTQQRIKIIQVLSLEKHATYKIGRSPDCFFKVSDISVSRWHAQLYCDLQGGLILRDHQSTFGTSILVRHPQLIEADNDYIFQVGRSLIKIELY